MTSTFACVLCDTYIRIAMSSPPTSENHPEVGYRCPTCPMVLCSQCWLTHRREVHQQGKLL